MISYLEFSKVDMTNIYSNTTNQILGFVMYNYLLILTPFMPFLSEYLYNKILLQNEVKNEIHSLSEKPYPNSKINDYYNKDIEMEFEV